MPKRDQRQSTRPAEQDRRPTSAGRSLTLLLSTVASLEADRAIAPRLGSEDTGGDAGQVADGPELLVALAELRRLRDRLAHWEPTLIAAARAQGVTWTDLAPALGVSSRQAAEARYLRLKREDDATATHQTREQRVRATRDRRSGDRAVAGWARDNAAALRRLAGQIAALPAQPNERPEPGRASDDGTTLLAAKVHEALGSDNVADLVGPLLDAQSVLSTTHPDLAKQVSDLAASAEQVRAADLNRRRTGIRTRQD